MLNAVLIKISETKPHSLNIIIIIIIIIILYREIKINVLE